MARRGRAVCATIEDVPDPESVSAVPRARPPSSAERGGSAAWAAQRKRSRQIRADQIAHAYAKQSVAIWGTVAIACFLVVVQWPAIQHPILLGWFGAILLVTALRTRWLVLYRWAQPAPAESGAWGSRFFAGALCAGLVWGAGGVLLFPAQDLVHQVLLAFGFAGMTAGGSVTMAAMWTETLLFLSLSLLPMTVRFLVVGDEYQLIMGAMVVLFLVALLQSARRVHETILETFRLRADLVMTGERLRKSEESRRSLIEELPVGIFQCARDFEGELLFANPTLARFLGYGDTEALGSVPIASMFVDPEDLDRVVDEVQTHGSVQGEEFRLRKKGGEEIWVSLTGTLVRGDSLDAEDCFDGVLEVITGRVEAQDALRGAHEHLHAVLTALPDLMFEVDRKGRIHAVHAPAPNLAYAPSRREALGKTVTDVMPADAAAVFMEAVAEAAEKGRYVGATYSLDLPDGVHWFELWIARKGRERDPQARLVVLVHDITEPRREAEALRARVAELEAASRTNT